MKTFLKLITCLFIWAVVTTIVIVGTMWLELPLSTGLWITAGLFGLWLIFLILRKLIIRFKAKRRVNALISEEKPESSNFKFKRFSAVSEASLLGKHFKNFIKLLNSSNLRNQGEPVYVLPWYFLMGESGSGKTWALNNARLPAPLFEHEAVQGEECCWYPYNQAIIIDIPGTCIIQTARSDQNQLGQLLRLLEKYRSKEPLNGIVITISAQHLLENNKHELSEQGRQYRARIDEIMQFLKVNIPVYLIITKCDLIQGFENWCSTLSEQSLLQAAGYARKKDDNKISVFVLDAFDNIVERIKDLILVNSSIDYRLLRLPDNMAKVKDNLAVFANETFGPNPYQEAPNLRGIYLSASNENTKEDSVKSLFLNQFFTEILPADRHIVSTFTGKERAGAATKRFIMGTWGIFVCLAFFLLSFTFMGHFNYLKNKLEQTKGAFVHRNVDTFFQIQEMILEVSSEVDSWWVPWFMQGKEPDFIRKMKDIYTHQFRKHQLEPADNRFKKNLFKNYSKNKVLPPKETARLVGALVSRINILEAFFQGANEDTLLSLPSPFSEKKFFFESKIPIDIFNQLYIQSLLWAQDKDDIHRELKTLRNELNKLLKASKNNFTWVIPLANDQIPENPIFNLSYYWTGSRTLNPDIKIPAAYTLEGKEFIDNYIKKLIATDPESTQLKSLKQEFDIIYKEKYLKAWKFFAMNFDNGLNTLRTRGEWVRMIDLVASKYNPYFKALDLMAQQLSPFFGVNLEIKQPEWVEFIAYFQDMQSYAPQTVDTARYDNRVKRFALSIVSKFGSIGKSLGKSGEEGIQAQRKLKKPETDDERAAVLEQSGKELDEYKKNLIDVAFNAESSDVSFKAMENFFANPNSPGTGDGHDAKAYQSVHRLQSLIGKERYTNAPFWRLYSGPLKLFREYMLKEAACAIQQKWADNFLVEIEGVPDYKLNSLMFGESGKVWQFLQKDIAAFISRKYEKGYVPVRINGRSMAFTSEFLNFISRNKDNVQTLPDNILVTINALPTHANTEALVTPSATTLKLLCGDKAQVLTNYNFVISKTFDWSNQCGDVLFSIEIGNLILEKIYSGPRAFPNFLKEFRFGRKRFIPKEFPEYEIQLQKLKIRYIDVEYQISGHVPVVTTLKATSLPVPQNIISCWPDVVVQKRSQLLAKKSNNYSSLSDNSKIFSAQIASFKQKNQAVNLATKIRAKGYQPFIFWFKSSKDNTKWYTVHLGTGGLKSDAHKAANLYNQKEHALIRVLAYKIDLLNERKIEF